MAKNIKKEDIERAVDKALLGQRLELVTRGDLRVIVSKQVERVLEALRKQREKAAELYGAPDMANALSELDATDELLGDIFELAGDSEDGPSVESWPELLQKLTVIWATTRRLRQHLEPRKSTFVPGLHDDSEELAADDESSSESIDATDNDGAGSEVVS